MSAHSEALPPLHAASLRVSIESIRRALLWLTAFSGAFVFIEPGPYEIVAIATMLIFIVTGMTFGPAVMPLAFVLILYNIGVLIALVPLVGQEKPVTWALISAYLSMTAVFFASMLQKNTERRLDILLRGYVAAGIVASIAGIIGYFHLVPRISEMFVMYERARATFNDPNVFGAFLVLPALLTLQRVLVGRPAAIARGGALLMLFVVGLLLSFSRAAWGQFVGSAALLLLLTFIVSRSHRERLRIVGLAAAGCLVLALFVVALLSIDQVADLFKERASIEQSYDSGHSGRFGRHVLGFLLALDRPLGIGPLQFAKIFPEDPHNAYLNSFMAGGWLSGVCYLTLVLVTLVVGFRYVFVAAPWRTVYMAVYAAFVGVAGESAIIDSDHWRHYFLLLGVIWGLIAASDRYRRTGMLRQPARPPPVPLAPTGVAA